MVVMKYRNIDSNKRPQVVSIEFSKLEPRDDSNDRPDEHNEGFWPSRDPDAAGYVLPENFEEEDRKARERVAAWNSDEWYYIGVVARATIHVPIGGNSFTVHTIDSAGLWGIESDAGDYLQEIYEEQLAELKGQLALMGAAFLALGPGGVAIDMVREAVQGAEERDPEANGPVLNSFNLLFPRAES